MDLQNLSKEYKDKVVVDSLNLKISQGELFALLGTNGAGKTTTIKILSTLILPTNGSAKIVIDKLQIHSRNRTIL